MLRIPSGITFGDVESLSALLPEERQEKIRRLRRGQDKVNSLFTGLLIKKRLSEILRLPDADRYIRYGRYGKPVLIHPARGYFSVSHSGGMIGFVFSGMPVGIDVESFGRYNLRIAGRFFRQPEQESVENAEDPSAAFCRIWTAKEAFLKMTGSGLSRPLNSFNVLEEYESGRMRTLAVSNYSVSVCSASEIADVTVKERDALKMLRDYSGT